MAPLMRTRLDAQVSSVVACTDASQGALGCCEARLPPKLIHELYRHTDIKGARVSLDVVLSAARSKSKAQPNKADVLADTGVESFNPTPDPPVQLALSSPAPAAAPATCIPVPEPCLPEPGRTQQFLLAVHLFSGPRRVGDVHHFFKQLAGAKNIPIHVEDRDIQILKQRNLLHDDFFNWLYAWAERGEIDFLIAGPPCGSFSRDVTRDQGRRQCAMEIIFGDYQTFQESSYARVSRATSFCGAPLACAVQYIEGGDSTFLSIRKTQDTHRSFRFGLSQN